MSGITRREFSHAVMGSAGVGLLLPLTSKTQERPRESSVAHGSLTDVPGIAVGHFTDPRRPTGCTALIFEGVATTGVDYDGSAPGSYLGVLLQPVSPIETIHAILLTGGGPMGLAAVPGAVRYLEERKTGFDWGIPGVRVPIVVGAVIDDLALETLRFALTRKRPTKPARRLRLDRLKKGMLAEEQAPPSARCYATRASEV